MSLSLGNEAVWFAQRYSRELADSVWSVGFYEHLLDVLQNETWREYETKAYGRKCRFNHLRDFLTSPDGLGWPTAAEVVQMMGIVSRCKPAPPPRPNELPDPPITEWARIALVELEKHGITAFGEKLEALPVAGPAPAAGMPSPNRDGINQHSNTAIRIAPDQKLSSASGGESQAYILRRIKRDHPDIADRLQQGEFKSARAAGIAAGFIKPSPPTVRLVSDLSVVASKLRQHLTSDQLTQLVEALLE